jgi:spermidine synthase
MLLYAVTIFLSAFLLFQIQPMIAKMILPWFGGASAVWITCMLFFQMGLLGGYIYAHGSIRYLRPKTQRLLHAGILIVSLTLLPVTPAISWKPIGNGEPIVRILGLLTVSIGLPYFLLSTTSPLIQAWYSRRYQTALPYRLFALSNLASLVGLLAYPFLIEPNASVHQQSCGWSLAYVLFVVVCLITTGHSAGMKQTVAQEQDEPVQLSGTANLPPRGRELILWLLLGGCASVLLLAVTNYLTQNVTSIPFLWILPLSLYLLSFILCFDFEGLYRRNYYVWLVIVAVGGMAYGLAMWKSSTSLKLVIPSFAACLFICCMFCHGELVKRKPAPQQLTFFYLMLSLGGVLGGILVGLVAPKVFPGYFELPIGLFIVALLLLLVNYRKGWMTKTACLLLLTGVIVASGYYVYSLTESTPVMVRNFYGGLRVKEYDKGSEDESRSLIHGTIIHGVQFILPPRRYEPITYFGPKSSGVGFAIQYLRKSSLRVGVIGLGIGTLAAYAQPGDVFRFYEINPLVVKLAQREFTYLADCKGKVEIVMGDGRLSLEQEPNQGFNLLVADAFSGDSIPAHLMTLQAFELYFRHLSPDGILALQITNTHLDLAPVISQLSKKLGKQAVLIAYQHDEKDEENEIYGSDWVLVSSHPLSSEGIKKASRELPSRTKLRIWTDDYSNLFQILKKQADEE